MSDSVITLPMGTADIDAALALEGGTFSGVSWSHAQFVDELMRDDRAWWIAVAEDDEDGDAVLGCAGIWVVTDEAHVLGVSVAPSSRRRGIARTLMAAVSDSARAMGARSLTLEVAVDNEAALGLYRSLGFEVEGIRTGYYPGGIDAVVMTGPIDGGEETR